MGALTVVTNCAIIALSPQVQEHYKLYGTLQVVLYIVVAEVSSHNVSYFSSNAMLCFDSICRRISVNICSVLGRVTVQQPNMSAKLYNLPSTAEQCIYKWNQVLAFKWMCCHFMLTALVTHQVAYFPFQFQPYCLYASWLQLERISENLTYLLMLRVVLSIVHWPTELKARALSARCIYIFIYFLCLTGTGIRGDTRGLLKPLQMAGIK